MAVGAHVKQRRIRDFEKHDVLVGIENAMHVGVGNFGVRGAGKR